MDAEHRSAESRSYDALLDCLTERQKTSARITDQPE